MSTVVDKASGAATWTARKAGRGLKPAVERAGHVIDLRALRGVQSLGWYGPMVLEPVDMSSGERDSLRGERDSLRGEMHEDSQRPDSLAS